MLNGRRKMFMKSKQLIAAISAASIACAIPFPAVLAEDKANDTPIPVISYTFDDGGNDDYSLENGASLVDRGDENGNAVSLSQASSQYVKLADNITEGLSGNFTITVDVKPKTEEWWTRVFDLGHGKSDDEDFKNIFFANHSETPKFDGAVGKYILQPNTNGTEDNFKLNEWNTAAIIRNGNTGYLYINGALRATAANFDLDLGYLADSNSNYLGRSAYDADPYFEGEIDNFKIYDEALNTDELIKQYNRYFITTSFRDTDNKKIFRTSIGDSVKAEVNLSNYKPDRASVTLSALTDTGIQVSSMSTHIDSASEASASLSFTVPENCTYIKLVLKINGIDYEGGYLPVADAEFPTAQVYSNPDDDPTYGAHDPTIFKDPVSGKYFAYSSHNLVFESDDLIDWVKHDYTSTLTVPQKAKAFIDNNYDGTEANATYWAPDILYVEGDEYPYWFYLSVSCGLGGRNSVISLIKAKSPGLWDGEYKDEGVILASKENNDYSTNAIDANIYSENGNNYFIWGSFWKGIHGAKLTSDGRIEGVDYTSDSSILSTSAKVGARLFATPGGVLGPEGAYTIKNNDNGYTYMFTSYGWLGTNYNCRIARTDKTFESILSDENPHHQFLDPNNNKVGTSYTEQEDKSSAWGYKLIGSYNLGGITYYGNGHNSVLCDTDGNWYYVQHSRKVADATAYLQVRKMLWTEDGWPVVSPLVYSGEQEQTIPVSMLYGTWNLCSVGHTILDGCTSVSDRAAYKGADAPVNSSEIIILPDGILASDLGTWEYDGDHTITLNFTKDGDPEKSQYFKSGDTMQLYVLAGFDEDENGGEKALVMTGTDNNHITQFAKKTSQATSDFSNKSEYTKPSLSNISKGQAGVSFTINEAQSGEAKAYVAEYNENNVLIKMTEQTITIPAEQPTDITVPVEIDDAAKTAKLIIWDNSHKLLSNFENISLD